MKPQSFKQRLGFESYVLAIAIACGALSINALAQDDALLADTESVLESEQIDVDGQFSRRESAADRLAKMRKKLEQQHEQMVQKKIEDIRVQEEVKLGSKLKKAFSGQLGNVDGDQVSVSQAAPQRVVAPAPLPAPVIKEEKNNNIVPSVGMTSIQGKNEDYESELSLGLSFESKLNKRFAVGLGFGYTTMDIIDVNPNYSGFSGFGGYNNGFNNNGFNNNANQGREMAYKQMDLSIDSKFFIAPDSKIQPFVGLGLGYRKANLKYKESDPYYNQPSGAGSQSLENTEYSSNYVTGSVLLGADIAFSDVIGARLMLSYTKGLTDSSTTDNTTTYASADEVNLENVGEGIEQANFGSLSAGLVISF